jgi:Tol biopolymer transport system component
MNTARSTVALLSVVAIATGVVRLEAQPGKGGGGTSPPPDPAIAYADSGIWVMNADGSNQRRLVSLRKGEETRAPSWSADDTEIVFYGLLGGVRGIYRVPVAGGAPTLVVSLSAPGTSFSFPEWSPVPAPDGLHKIVFEARNSITGGPFDTCLVNPDGTGLTNLTGTPATAEWQASWAPDGRYIVVKRGSFELMMYELGEDSGEVVIVNQALLDPGVGVPDQPSWANSAPRIVCTLTTETLDRALVVYDLSMPVPTMTHLGISLARHPCFSPDDSKIVFARPGTSGTAGIYVVNADGTGETRIASRGSECSWRRNP